MLSRQRRRTALVVLGTALFPWLSACLVALHLAGHVTEHEAGARATAAGLAAHGHHHEPGTPDHEHRMTLPGSPPPPARLAPALLPPALLDLLSEAVSSSDRLAPTFGSLGHDPPRVQRSHSILRV
jgi:hypothetical protein